MKKYILLLAAIFTISFANAQWVQTSLSNNNVFNITINGNNIFAGTYGGIYLSIDEGSTWNSVNNGIPASSFVYAIAISGNNIFAGIYGKGVYLSTNNGNSWAAVNNGLTNLNVLSLVIKNDTVFAGTQNGGVFRTTNNGNSWGAFNNGLSNTYIKTLAVSGKNIFAGSNGNGIFYTPNNGINWYTTDLSDYIVNTIISTNDTIFAGTSNGVYTLTNNGSNLFLLNTGLTNIDVTSFIIRNDTLFTGTFGGGMCFSTNWGHNWNAIDTVITLSNITSLASNGNYIFAGADGLWRRPLTDFIPLSITAKWQLTEYNCHSIIMDFGIRDTNIFALSFGSGVYLSTKQGYNWATINNNLTDTFTMSIGFKDDNIFIGTSSGMFKSSNNGNNWTSILSTNDNISAIAVKDSNIYAGMWGSIYLSTDNGNNWVSIGFNYGYSIYTLVINGSDILVGTDHGLYLSTNNGITWVASGLTNHSVNSITIKGINIFAATDIGVYLSTNNGVDWIAIENGLPANTPINKMVVKGNTIFAVVDRNNVYFSTDDGESWVTENNGLPSYPTIYGFNTDSSYLLAGGIVSGIGKIWRLALIDTLKTYSYPTNGGSSTGGGAFNINQSCTVKAISNPGYKFLNWTDNTHIVSIDTNFTFTIKANRKLVANFTSTLGIKENTLNNISIYPNPTKDNLTIEINSTKEQRLEIINLIGQTIYTNIINKKATINTSAFANGVYIIKLYTNKETIVRKFVKE